MHDDTELNFEKTTNFIIARGENYYLTRNKKIQGVINYNIILICSFQFLVLTKNSLQQVKKTSWLPTKILKTGDVIHEYDNFYTGAQLSFTPHRKVFGYGVEQRYGKNSSLYTPLNILKG